MGDYDTKEIHKTLDRVYTLYHKMEEKIHQWEIWTDASTIALSSIRRDAQQSIADVFDFCENEYLHTMGAKWRKIRNIQFELKQILADENYPALQLSFFSSMISSTMKSLCDYLNYEPVIDGKPTSSSHIILLSPVINNDRQLSDTPQKSKSKPKSHLVSSKEIIDSVNTELTTLKQLLDCHSIEGTSLKTLLDDNLWEFTPDNVHNFLKHDLYRSFSSQETIELLNELTRLTKLDLFSLNPYDNPPRLWAIRFVNQLKNIFSAKENDHNQYHTSMALDSERKQSKKRNFRKLFKKSDTPSADENEQFPSPIGRKSVADPVLGGPILQESVPSEISIKSRPWKNCEKNLWYISNNLTKIWEEILARLDIPDEINEIDYPDVLDEYREYIISQIEKLRLKTQIHTIVQTYNSCSAKTHETHRMGEMFVLIDTFLLQAKKQWEESERIALDEASRLKIAQEQEILHQEMAYFPQLIQLLENFKKNFSDSAAYKNQSVGAIKETFSEMFDSSVLQPFTQLHPKLFSFSEESMRGLWYLNRKHILNDDIKNIFKKASEQQVLRWISQWWFFADIDDFVQILKIQDMTTFVETIQKTYTRI